MTQWITGIRQRLQRGVRWTNRANRNAARNNPARDISVQAERLENRLLLTFFADTFDAGLLSYWSVPNLDGDGQVQVTNAFSVDPGGKSLLFDSAGIDAQKDLNEAILTVNVLGRSAAVLTFQQLEGSLGTSTGDENELLAVSHVTETGMPRPAGALGDGISISNDGMNWYRLDNIEGNDFGRGGDGLWLLYEYDLKAEVARINAEQGVNLQFTSDFKIKFSQYDNLGFSDDGWVIDDIKISEAPRVFSPAVDREAFHRFNLPGEAEADLDFRIGLFGNVGPETPILVSQHGLSRGIFSFTHQWSRFVSDPANGVDGLVVIAPRFLEDGLYDSYGQLAWNDANYAAADLVLLSLVDNIAAQGVGNGSKFYMFGFSAGGQFTQRFGLAHPDRLLASVVASPSSHAIPNTEVPFQYGIGPSATRPEPDGVNLNPDDFLASRVMYWIGQEDSSPDLPNLDTSTRANTQGPTRLHRAVNSFEASQRAADESVLTRNEFEYELFIQEGNGHTLRREDYSTFHEFLFRDLAPFEDALIVHSRVVLKPTELERTVTLPQSVSRVNPSTKFYLELWLEAPPGASGVRTGEVDVFFDTSLADVLSIDHGSVFDMSTTGTIEEAAGRIRSFGGETNLPKVGVDRFGLLGRVEFLATDDMSDPIQFAQAIQRGANPFELENAFLPRVDLDPISRLDIGGVDSSTLQGTVFDDVDIDGIHDATEFNVADRGIQLLNPEGSRVTHTLSVDPDDFPDDLVVNSIRSQVQLTAIGSEAVGTTVFISEVDDGPFPRSHFFSLNTDQFESTEWGDGIRELRFDFAAPTSMVSLDAIATPFDALDIARLDIFDVNGNVLGTYLTSDLIAQQSETMTLSRPEADIAFAIASGAGTHNVRLDNLVFTSEISTVTDADGHYVLSNVPAGDYILEVVSTLDNGVSAPEDGVYSLSLSAGSIVADLDFGLRELLDFGDAPDSYSTTEDSNGPRHTAAGPRLGSNRDTELDAQSPLNGNGDDFANTGSIDDEDGVSFPLMRVAQVSFVTFDVTNVTSTATVQGWIDYDQNGIFDHPSEQVVNRTVGTNGQFQIAVFPPLGSVGETFARFRISATGSLVPTGLASGGEVEDYAITIFDANGDPTISDILDQETEKETSTGPIAFTINDGETPSEQLTLSATSSDTSIIPNSQIFLGGSGADRTITLIPAANVLGSSTITVTVRDGEGGLSMDTFVVTVVPLNTPPTISGITDRTIIEDASTGMIPFSISDVPTPSDELVVTVVSSNLALVPNENIELAGSGGSRSVTVTPAADLSGTATVTITVTDVKGASATEAFDVIVEAQNDIPTVTDIGDFAIDEDNATGVAFVVSDVETAPDSLIATASSSNEALIAPSGIVLGGSGINRAIALNPIENASGVTTITIMIADADGGVGIESFVLTVNEVIDNPTITEIGDQLINEDSATAELAFEVNDVESTSDLLTLSAQSSDTLLVPIQNVSFSGSGTDRTVIVTPAAGQSGTATITVTVADPSGGTSDEEFIVQVNALPVISDINDQTTDEDIPTGEIAFTLTDIESAANSLIISIDSSQPSLVPVENIVIGGTGENRTLTISPLDDRFGSTVISLTVEDEDGGVRIESFELIVNAVNDDPRIGNIEDQVIEEDGFVDALQFTTTDPDSANSLMLSATSSNPALIPAENIGFGVVVRSDGGINRTISMTPIPDAFGTAVITVTVEDDGGATSSTMFDLTVNERNDSPTITEIADQVIVEDSSTGSLAFTVGDEESLADQLVVTVDSSNPVLVAAGNVLLGGDGANRTITVTPTAERFGQTTISVTVADPDGGSSTETFLLTVNSAPDDIVYDVPPSAVIELILRRNASMIELVRADDGVVVLTDDLATTDSITINGRDNFADRLTLDFDFGGAFQLDGGVHFNGGLGEGDSVRIAGGLFDVNRFTSDGTDTGLIELGDLQIFTTDTESAIDESQANERVFQNVADADATIQIVDTGIFDLTTLNMSGVGGIKEIAFRNPLLRLTVLAGSGDDDVNVGSVDENFTAELVIQGESGNDRLDASTLKIPVELAGGPGQNTLFGGRGADLLLGGPDVDILRGGRGNDSLFGNAGDDKLVGQGGKDLMFGGTGKDRLFGGSGKDTLDGGEGDDVLRGQGFSFDVLIGGPGNDTIDGGGGIDIVRESGDVDFVLTDTQLTGLGTDRLIRIERAELTGGDSDNSIDASGFTGPTTLIGGKGDDSLIGGSDNDRIEGGIGNDTLIGLFGSDTLVGGDGRDGLSGGSGRDLLSGNSGRDTLIGGRGRDSLFGGAGADILLGGIGSDKLVGQGGTDTLNGGLGNDQLVGLEEEIDTEFTFFADWIV